MRKVVVSSILMCLASISLQAQQLFQSTQFMTNPYTINPALAGSEDFIDIKAGYRSQWAGLDDSNLGSNVAPRTTYLSAHSAIGKPHNYYRDPRNEKTYWHGVGGLLLDDKAGAFSNTSLYGSYSFSMVLYKPKVQTKALYGFNGQERFRGVRVTVGTHVGVVQQRIDFSSLRTFNDIDAAGGEFDLESGTTDRALNNSENTSRIAPDASLGTFIYANDFYVGLSIRRILGNNLDVSADTSTEFTFSRNFVLMGGYKFFISDFIQIEPSALVRFEPNAPASVDLNALVAYDNTRINKRGTGASRVPDLHIYGGLTYRPGAALALVTGAVIKKKFEVAYSVDFSINGFQSNQNGSHEVTLGYRILPSRKFHIAEEHWSKL